MKITLLGASGGIVTGSSYLVEAEDSRLLVDAGMFQGETTRTQDNHFPEWLKPQTLTCVLLTHAHLDHTGRIPLLCKAGYQGPFYTHEASIELTEIVLQDTAKIQQQDAERHNRKNPDNPITPLYVPDDVLCFKKQAISVPYHESKQVAKGVSARFFDAGHILGSASIELTVEEKGKRFVIVFSGDIGPLHAPIIRDYETFQQADLVFLESTYGDRDHKPYPETVAEFEKIVLTTAQNSGKIIIPAFAIGRTQELLYELAQLFYEKKVTPFPVYIDSPMAIRCTDVFLKHPDLYDQELIEWKQKGLFQSFAPYYHPTPSVDESKALNDLHGPMAIIAGSGMCTGGRIIHHLAHNLPNPHAQILIVGFQAQGTLGRALVDGAKEVMIHGRAIPVRAPIATLNGFSAHAGQTDLLHWLSTLAPAKPRVILTHGENPQRETLKQKIKEKFNIEAQLPNLFDVIEL
jgi:metallo-beta-lactamase family protein